MKTKILIISVLALFVLAISFGEIFSAQGRPDRKVGVSGEKNYQDDCFYITPPATVTVIQHDQWGSQACNEQQVGSMGRMIAADMLGHRHMVFHDCGSYPICDQHPRYVIYNCKDPLGAWTGGGEGIWIDGGPNICAGYPNIGLMHDGREVIVYHRAAGAPPWYSTLTVGDEGYICSGYFTAKYDLPDNLGIAYEGGTWPKLGIVYDSLVDTNYIHIVMTEGESYNQKLGYVRCHLLGNNNLLCETPTGQAGVISPITVPPNTQLIPNPQVAYFGETSPGSNEYPNTISAIVATSPVSRKVAIVFTNKREPGDNPYNNDVFYFESTNNGIEWFPQYAGQWPPTIANGMLHNVSNYPGEIQERAYTDVSACYDYNDSLHIVWTATYYDSVAGLTSADANLYHWSQATGIFMVAPGYWGDTNPGDWNRNISKPSVSAKNPMYHSGGSPDSVYLFCTWTQFDSGDVAWNGYSNGDIYTAVSNDGGLTWTPGYNLTNTKRPNCDWGDCLSSHWSSLAENMYNGDLHIEYVCDRDAGAELRDEGEQTDNPMMYLHVAQLPFEYHCGVALTNQDPQSWTEPPLQVPPTGSKVISFKLHGIYNLGGVYEVTSNHPRVPIIMNQYGYLNPGETKVVEAEIHCGGQEFIDAIITIRSCIGTVDEDTIKIPLYAVCSNDYYACDRDPATTIEDSNSVLKLWTCVNTSQEVWDKRIAEENKQKVIFSGGVIVATTVGPDTIVGRQDYKDTRTGARDTIRTIKGYLYAEPDCDIQKIYVTKTYIWYPPEIPQTPKWYWIDIYKQIIFFYDRPGYPPCPEWKKEQVIKYVWIKFSRPPGWWPSPGVYTGHNDIYFGYFADINAPYDAGCIGCNAAGWDDVNKIVWQSGFGGPNHPEYANYYVGLALTNSAGDVITPYGCQDVLNVNFLYPQDGWGWKDGELYQLAATPGVLIDPGGLADRTVVLTVGMIPASINPNDTTWQSEFILIEAMIRTGLDDLKTHIVNTRQVLIPELNSAGVFSKIFPICGDVNGDGNINSADVVYLLSYLHFGGPPPVWPLSRADVNNDTRIDSLDLYTLGSCLAGQGSLECNGGMGNILCGDTLDCTKSYSDSCLTFCPLGDIDFKVTLRDNTNDPMFWYSNVWLDFSNCLGDIIPCPSFHPQWPLVFPEGPSDSNGRVYFRVHAGGYSDNSVKVMAGCGQIAEVFFPKSVDLSGNLLVEPSDFDENYGNNRDFNCDDTVDWRDDNIFKCHKNHGCSFNPCLFLQQTIVLDPDTTLVPGDSIDVKWRMENLNSFDTCYIEKVDLYYTNFSGSVGLIKFHTEYWNSNLPPRGNIQLTVRDFIVPDLPNMCVIARTYTDCCTLYAEAKNCWDIRRICPPDAITYRFSMINVVPPAQIDTTVSMPIEWSYSILWNMPDSVIVEITTDDESPMGTRGRVTIWFKYDSVWEDKNFDVVFTLNSGDVNSDCIVNVSDVVYLINYLFIGGPAPDPLRAGDVNCDCVINVSDVVYLINYLFIGGPPPVSSETCECEYEEGFRY